MTYFEEKTNKRYRWANRSFEPGKLISRISKHRKRNIWFPYFQPRRSMHFSWNSPIGGRETSHEMRGKRRPIGIREGSCTKVYKSLWQPIRPSKTFHDPASTDKRRNVPLKFFHACTLLPEPQREDDSAFLIARDYSRTVKWNEKLPKKERKTAVFAGLFPIYDLVTLNFYVLQSDNRYTCLTVLYSDLKIYSTFLRIYYMRYG